MRASCAQSNPAVGSENRKGVVTTLPHERKHTLSSAGLSTIFRASALRNSVPQTPGGPQRSFRRSSTRPNPSSWAGLAVRKTRRDTKYTGLYAFFHLSGIKLGFYIFLRLSGIKLDQDEPTQIICAFNHSAPVHFRSAERW